MSEDCHDCHGAGGWEVDGHLVNCNRCNPPSKEDFAREFIEAVEEFYQEWLDEQEGVKSLPDFEEALERVKREGMVATK
jgi:hypothetical protein